MANFCKYCGTQLAADALFCTGCGKPVEQPAGKEKPASNDVLADAVVRYRGTKDPADFKQIYDLTYKKLFGQIYSRSKDKEVTEDVLQSTYLKAFEHFDQAKEPKAFGGWIAKICHNEYLEHVKKLDDKVVSAEFVMPDGESVDLLDSIADDKVLMPEKAAEDAALHRLLLESMTTLPEKQRYVVYEHFFSERKEREIAEDLGVPVNSVKTCLRRGKNTMKESVDRYANANGLKLAPLALIPFLAALFTEDAKACEFLAPEDKDPWQGLLRKAGEAGANRGAKTAAKIAGKAVAGGIGATGAHMAAETVSEISAGASAQAAEAAKAQAQALAAAEAQAKAEAQALAEAQARAEAEARAQAEAQARAQAEAEARAQANAQAEAQARAEAEARAKAEAQAQAEARARAEAQATAIARAEAMAAAGAVAGTAAGTAAQVAGHAGRGAGKAFKRLFIAVLIIGLLTTGLGVYCKYFVKGPEEVVAEFVDAMNRFDTNGMIRCMDPSSQSQWDIVNRFVPVGMISGVGEYFTDFELVDCRVNYTSGRTMEFIYDTKLRVVGLEKILEKDALVDVTLLVDGQPESFEFELHNYGLRQGWLVDGEAFSREFSGVGHFNFLEKFAEQMEDYMQ